MRAAALYNLALATHQGEDVWGAGPVLTPSVPPVARASVRQAHGNVSDLQLK